MLLEEGLRAVVHILLDLLEQLTGLLREFVEGNLDLLTGITTYQYGMTGLDILRTDLDTKRNTSYLTVRELESR